MWACMLNFTNLDDEEESAAQIDDIMERLRSRITHPKTWLDATKALRISNTVSFDISNNSIALHWKLFICIGLKFYYCYFCLCRAFIY